MLGANGLQKEPVYFKIFGSVMGIPHSAADQPYYETRKKTEIAMLRRLPPNRVIELPGPQEDDPPPESLEAQVPAIPIEELGWRELCDVGMGLNVFKVGMTKSDLIGAILSARKKPMVITIA